MGPKTILQHYTADHFQFAISVAISEVISNATSEAIHNEHLHSLANIHDVTSSSTFGNLGNVYF